MKKKLTENFHHVICLWKLFQPKKKIPFVSVCIELRKNFFLVWASSAPHLLFERKRLSQQFSICTFISYNYNYRHAIFRYKVKKIFALYNFFYCTINNYLIFNRFVLVHRITKLIVLIMHQYQEYAWEKIMAGVYVFCVVF